MCRIPAGWPGWGVSQPGRMCRRQTARREEGRFPRYRGGHSMKAGKMRAVCRAGLAAGELDGCWGSPQMPLWGPFGLGWVQAGKTTRDGVLLMAMGCSSSSFPAPAPACKGVLAVQAFYTKRSHFRAGIAQSKVNPRYLHCWHPTCCGHGARGLQVSLSACPRSAPAPPRTRG